MSNRLDIDSYTNLTVAEKFLSTELQMGSLSLVLGAGVSKAMGLPLWWELVKVCCDSSGITHSITDETHIAELKNLMDEVEKKAGGFENYSKIVHNALYGNIKSVGQLIHHDLLIALGALLMGSRRGSIREVLTFNIDDVLEWYLKVHGYKSSIVPVLPMLRRESDVTVYHPHGFLPYKSGAAEASNFIILSGYSYDKRMGSRLDAWKELTRDLLLRKFAIFVGLSGNDDELNAICSHLADDIRKDRITGFYLLGPKVSKDDSWFFTRNLVPLRFTAPDHSDIPAFLLRVCERAARI